MTRSLKRSFFFALALALLPSCFLIKLPKQKDSFELMTGAPKTRGPVRRYRFALLAPFEQVANAARVELSAAPGATQLESAGDDSVRFVIRDELEAGEDFITLRQEGTILVLLFRVHTVPNQAENGAGPENPGLAIKKRQQELSENPGKKAGPGEGVQGMSAGKDKDETDAAKSRRHRIARLIICLPGVGDLVDGDGAPKEKQLVTSADRAIVCSRGGDAGLPTSPTSTPTPEAVPVPPLPADAGKD
jgi:hypothetical protein